MLYQEALGMATRDCQLDISEKDVQFSFGMCKMVVTNEVTSYKNYGILLFPEFLEYIGRLADAKFKNSDMVSMPLAWKIDQILEELCPAFGLTKNEVNIMQEDNSESDDDY